jgi:hypothetical protein
MNFVHESTADERVTTKRKEVKEMIRSERVRIERDDDEGLAPARVRAVSKVRLFSCIHHLVSPMHTMLTPVAGWPPRFSLIVHAVALHRLVLARTLWGRKALDT